MAETVTRLSWCVKCGPTFSVDEDRVEWYDSWHDKLEVCSMISLWIAACLALWFAIGYATYRLALSNADEEEIDDVNEGRTVFTCLGPIPIVVVGILCLVQYVEEKMTKHER